MRTTHYFGDDCRNGHHEPDVFETFAKGGRIETHLDCPCGWTKVVEATQGLAEGIVKRACQAHIEGSE